ncbi:hypothetical protein J2X72_001299 [Phyllobacterium sp. 1468]|nr:hypothetical protein [Phyllobacterium sp. 1468]
MSIQSQFCFADGETIHAEGSEADVYPSDDARLTKWLAASRKPIRPGEFAPNPLGFGFVR